MHCGHAIYPKRMSNHNPKHTRNTDTADGTRASFHSPLHCLYWQSSRSCMDNHCATTINHRNGTHRVDAWTIITQQAVNHRNSTHRVAVGASGSSPEIHALQTRNLSPKGHHIIIQTTHATQTRRTERGRASTRPYIACIGNHRVDAWAIIAKQNIYHRNGTHRVDAWAIIAKQTVNHRNDTHRVAVGASGSSPETHALGHAILRVRGCLWWRGA